MKAKFMRKKRSTQVPMIEGNNLLKHRLANDDKLQKRWTRTFS